MELCLWPLQQRGKGNGGICNENIRRRLVHRREVRIRVYVVGQELGLAYALEFGFFWLSALDFTHRIFGIEVSGPH